MKVLNILKTEPDETVEELTQAFAGEEVETIPLYDGDVDWSALVDEIFAADKVVCWW